MSAKSATIEIFTQTLVKQINVPGHQITYYPLDAPERVETPNFGNAEQARQWALNNKKALESQFMQAYEGTLKLIEYKN